MSKKWLRLFLLLLVLSLSAGAFADGETVIYNTIKHPDCLKDYQFDPNDKLLHVWFPAVSNADAAIVLYDDQVWLLDCGDERNGDRTATLLEKLGITEVNKLINSHPHHDHLLGMYNVHKTAHIDELAICFSRGSTDTMTYTITVCKNAHIPVTEYTDGDTMTMGVDGKVTMTFWRNYSTTLDMNNCSALTMVQYGSRRILFTADCDRLGQAELMTRLTAAELDADILKYPHHGKHALEDSFFDAVTPSLSIITNTSVGWTGVSYLRTKKVPYYFTSNGSKYIHLYTDGKIWVVEQVPYKKVTPWKSQEAQE